MLVLSRRISLLVIFLVLVIAQNVMAETFTANLSPAQEVPASGTGGSGYARVFLNETTMTINFVIVFSNLSSNQTAAHIHSPAPIGMNASPVITFTSPGGTSNTITGSAPVTATLISQMRANQAYINIHSANFPGGEIRGQLALRRPLDYDGDGKTDYSVLRFPTGVCPGFGQITYWNRNSLGFASNQTIDWGNSCTDFPAPGDYDGDGKDDLAVYRDGLATGQQSFFIIYRTSDNTVQFVRWGLFDDQPVARDYDGDGITDIAVFRYGPLASSKTTWFIRQSSDQSERIEPYGLTGNGSTQFDVPVPGDYDGDGKFDLAVYRFGQSPANHFIIKRSSDSVVTFTQWGNFNSDFIAPGDYDGDGKFDLAAVRTGATGVRYTWFIRQSSNGMARILQWGVSASTVAQFDLPTQGDYDGDGVTDISIWRPSASGSDSAFYTYASFTNTALINNWGLNGDFVVNAFDAR